MSAASNPQPTPLKTADFDTWKLTGCRLVLKRTPWYIVDLDVSSSAQILDWIFHQRARLEPQELIDLLTAIELILHPRANFCSFGSERNGNGKQLVAAFRKQRRTASKSRLMPATKNKGRKKGSGLIADPFFVADFKGFQVVAHQCSTRFFIQWDWALADDKNPGFTAFKQALKRLEESTNYRPIRAHNSLIGDLSSDWEPAHIFVALNLHQLQAYAAGKPAHFNDPSFCCWLAMEQSWRHAVHVGGRH